MRQTPPSVKSQRSQISIALACVLICAALVGLSYLLNNIENTIYQASMKPIPTGTPDDPDPNAPVTCNAVSMPRNATCEHTDTINGQKEGLPTDYTYEEQKEYQKQLRLDHVVLQRENLSLQQHQQPRPFGGLLGCLSLPLFLLGVCGGIVMLVIFGRSVARFFKHRQAY